MAKKRNSRTKAIRYGVDPEWEAEPYLRRGRGAPTKLTPQLQKQICQVVELCNTLEDAAAHVGVHRATVFMWQQKGREEKEGMYRDFYDAIETAKSRRRVNGAAQMLQHGKRHWQALLGLLERTDPQYFGLRVKVQINEELERMMDRLERNLTPQEYERALQAISQPDDSGEETAAGSSAADADGHGLSSAVGAAVVAALPGAVPSEGAD